MGSVGRSSGGCRTTSVARTRCLSPSFLKASAFTCCCILPAIHSCSCCYRDWCSLRGVKSIRSSRRLAPTSMAASLPRRTTACCTPPRGLQNPEQYLSKEEQKACLDSAAAELIREITQQRARPPPLGSWVGEGHAALRG